ncbi:hypothetical protein Tco_0475699 [Tanacetum coccineum]
MAKTIKTMTKLKAKDRKHERNKPTTNNEDKEPRTLELNDNSNLTDLKKDVINELTSGRSLASIFNEFN